MQVVMEQSDNDNECLDEGNENINYNEDKVQEKQQVEEETRLTNN